MSDVWIVIDEDRHTDVDAVPFSTEEGAVAKARDSVPEDAEEERLNEAMLRDGWVLFLSYGTEGDGVRVVKRVMDDTGRPPRMTPAAYKHLRKMERELGWKPTPTPPEARPVAVPGRGYGCPQCGIFEAGEAGAAVPERRDCHRCRNSMQPQNFPPLEYPHGYPWWTERLGAAFTLLSFGAVLGGLAGVGSAWASTALRLVSPDNVGAGLAFGFGGAMAGALAALAALLVSGRRRRVL